MEKGIWTIYSIGIWVYNFKYLLMMYYSRYCEPQWDAYQLIKWWILYCFPMVSVYIILSSCQRVARSIKFAFMALYTWDRASRSFIRTPSVGYRPVYCKCGFRVSNRRSVSSQGPTVETIFGSKLPLKLLSQWNIIRSLRTDFFWDSQLEEKTSRNFNRWWTKIGDSEFRSPSDGRL